MPEFKVSYEDLISGDLIPMPNVGFIRSPKLSEMRPSSGIGWDTYNLYVFFLRSGKEQLNQLLKMDIKSDDDLFNSVINNETIRGIYNDAFNFFIDNNVSWNDTHKLFVITKEIDGNDIVIGLINEDNFEYVRAGILLVNYITADKTNIKTSHSSPEAEAAWNKVQEYLAQIAEKNTAKKDNDMSIGNMLSKLCSIHPSINYLNVFDLTIFQFYDTFFQTCYMRSINFTEAIVSTNGSKEFKYGDWLKPIQTYN